MFFSFIYESHFRVLPWHLDLNFHVNNATYLNFCNQARLEYLSSAGLFKFLVKRKINPIIYKNEIQYRKSLQLFEKFSVKTRLDKIEMKEVQIIHDFYRSNQLVATCTSHAKLVSKEKYDYITLLQDFSNEKK